MVGGIALIAAFAGKFQGELLIGVAFGLVIVGDLVGAYRAFGAPSIELDIDGDGEVGTDLSATVVAHGNRQALWVRFGWWDPRWFTLVAGVPGWNRLRPGARGTIRWIDVDLVARGPARPLAGRPARPAPPRPAGPGGASGDRASAGLPAPAGAPVRRVAADPRGR